MTAGDRQEIWQRSATEARREFRALRRPRAVRLRKRFSLKFLMLVTTLFGLNFAWVPWPVSLLVGLAIIAGACMVGLTWVESIGFAGIVLVLAWPAISHYHSRESRPAVGPALPKGSPAATPAPAKGR